MDLYVLVFQKDLFQKDIFQKTYCGVLCRALATYLVELAGGELRVMRQVDALIPELPANLVHPV